MGAARVRSAVTVTTAFLAVLGVAGLAHRGPPAPVPPAGPPLVSASAAWPPPGPRTTVEIDPGALPATAARNAGCAPGLGGGPHPGEDVWAFGLPAGAGAARFVAVRPVFVTPDQGRVALTLPADGGVLADGPDGSVAWVRLPGGWTLESATATVAGDVNHFVLAATCPALAPRP